MKTWKLVSGILSIVMSVFVLFQSGLVGISNSLSENGETGGSAGLIVAVVLLTGGIVSIATRSGGRGGNFALLILFALAALIGFTNAGGYGDLQVWSGWCLICAAMAFIGVIRGKKKV